MVKINDRSLKALLKEDFECDRFEGISKEFVGSYLQTENPDNKFIQSLLKSLTGTAGSTSPEWLDQFLIMIDKLQSYETLLYSMRGYRDHIAHAVRVSLLGYYLMTRPPLKKFIDHSECFQTEWLFASLFHDICIPLSRLQDVQSKVGDMMRSYSGIDFIQQAEFGINVKVFPEIKKVLHDEGAEFCIDLMQGTTQAEHGALGAIVVLHTFHGHLEDSILQDIVSSISLHDAPCSFVFSENKLAGLLVLSDELQEWDRPFIDRASFEKVLRLDFVDLDLSNSSIRARLDYYKTSSIEGYIPVEVNEIDNFEKKKSNLARMSLPFELLIQTKDRDGKSLVYP